MGVVEIERLVIVVDFRQIWIGEDFCQDPPFGADLGFDLAIGLAHPAAVPLLLVFPFLGVADARLGLDIVEPGVFDAFAVGPDVLAGHRTGVTSDALVEIEHHADLCADSHSAASSFCFSGPSSQSILVIFRTMTNSSRLEPTVP